MVSNERDREARAVIAPSDVCCVRGSDVFFLCILMTARKSGHYLLCFISSSSICCSWLAKAFSSSFSLHLSPPVVPKPAAAGWHWSYKDTPALISICHFHSLPHNWVIDGTDCTATALAHIYSHLHVLHRGPTAPDPSADWPLTSASVSAPAC